MKKIILSVFALVLTGCASNGSDGNTAKNDDGYRCEKVYTISSNIPKKICNTRAQREEIEKQSKEGLRDIQSSVGDPFGG
ncbi:hypothetical protein SG34_003065 [Thalassomonas viridans]|uniref:Lipoprotein n=1 Tax=Thalassomonas viridans TaxID=137584 RepID=A0AAF0C9X9_9GAMM|nr:hypothetical protein [Thalassomonas viridans]WDE05926.1 hypothetical protein SG34_003065 [Thalassomonas viridans]